MSPDAPALSVVVPTRDRPGSLAACLGAIAAQDAPSFEIVVVDDASVDGEAVAQVVGAATPLARVLRGEGRGPAAARNLGAEHARGAILCFTDDDCRPVRGWLTAVQRRMATGEQVVVGPTVNGRDDDPCASASQTITNHLVESSLDSARGIVSFAPTSNLAARASLLARFRFDEGYPLAAGEDREWCRRVTGAGVAIAYEPDAVVRHHPDLNLRAFWRQQVRYGRGAHRFHDERDAGPQLQAPAFYTGLLRKGFEQGVRVGSLVALAQAATAVGMGSAWLADRRA